MNYPTRSADCSSRDRLEAANAHARGSVGVNADARPTLRGSGSHRIRRIGQARPEAREWEAVQEIFLASRQRFVGLAYSILRNKEDAEDAVQDAFLSACRHLRTFEGRSAFTTWFTRIVMNAALMVRRKRKPSWIDATPDSLATDETPWTERIPGSLPDPEILYVEGETVQWIDVMLAKMTPILREAFTMTYYDEMSNEEAGALQGVTTGTFKSRLLRARRHLMNQARRFGLAPVRRRTHCQFSFAKNDFQNFAPRAAEISSPEIAFS